jgi:hypothetical protein
MGGEPLAFSRVEDNHEVVSIVSENTSPSLLQSSIQPHEFILGSTLDLPVVFSIEGLEFILEGLGWFLFGDEDNTECAFGSQADILGALVVQFGDYIIKMVHISVIHCLVAEESRELPPPGTKT